MLSSGLGFISSIIPSIFLEGGAVDSIGFLEALWNWVVETFAIVRDPLANRLEENDSFLARTLLIFLQPRLWVDTGSTLAMVGISGLAAVLFGTPLGVLQVLTDQNGLKPNAFVNKVFGAIINIGRSIPFVIIAVIMGGVSRYLLGSMIGVIGMLIPLSLCAIPFMARIAETSLKEVPQGLVEAALSMGASPFQIIRKVLLPEAMPSLIAGITIMLITLVGYSAMAGLIGGGGLGDYAIYRGYGRNRWEIVLAAIIVIVGIVQLTQYIGDVWAKKVNHR